MKKLIIPIAIFCMALLSCSEKAPSMHTDFEYTIEDIENDPSWVEITDVEEYFEYKCIREWSVNDNQKLLLHNDYFIDNESKLPIFELLTNGSCQSYNLPKFDFNSYYLISNRFELKVKNQFSFYYNSHLKQFVTYIRLGEKEPNLDSLINEGPYGFYRRWHKIPKSIEINSMHFVYDSLWVKQ